MHITSVMWYRIQAVYRGYRARKLFQQLLDANPPQDAERRKVFYARKVSCDS